MDKLQNINRFNTLGFTSFKDKPISDSDQFTSILTSKKDNAKGEAALSNSLREVQDRFANTQSDYPSTQSALMSLMDTAMDGIDTLQLEPAPLQNQTVKTKTEVKFESKFISTDTANSTSSLKHEMSVREETVLVIEN